MSSLYIMLGSSMPIAAATRLARSERIAWAGAAVFIASQFWFFYSYLVRFAARKTAVGVLHAVALDTALFSLFALHHSVLARAHARRVTERLVPAELARSAYTWTASLLFIAVCTWWQPVPGVAYSVPGAWHLLGYAVQIIGLALTLKSSGQLDFLDLAGVRQVQRARGGTAPAHVPLETRGLYGFVRHPLYFAWVLMVFGAPDMSATRLTFALVSTAYLAIAVPWEERGLLRIFGADYEAYRRHVRWRMVPFLY